MPSPTHMLLLCALLCGSQALTREALVSLSKQQLIEMLVEESADGEEKHTPLPHGSLAVIGGYPPIWPHPAIFSNGSAHVLLDPSLFQLSTTTPCPDLQAAFARYAALLFPRRLAPSAASSSSRPSSSSSSSSSPSSSPSPSSSSPSVPSSAATTLPSLVVSVSDISGTIQLDTDESYTLSIPADGSPATLTAPTLAGAYHGLETFSQLVVFDYDTKTYGVAAAPWLIEDYPRFKHRELLVDSSRHFLPAAALRALLDTLPAAKINVLHWHLLDSPSFPMRFPSHPELAQRGAFSASERYTAADVADLVEYARQRGVRVVVEIDTPGHAASWCAGRPDVCPLRSCLEPLNVANEETFALIEDLLGDVTGRARGGGLFPDNMVHLGGDEVDTACWAQNASIVAWLQARGLSLQQGYQYFVNRTQEIARLQGRDVIGWQEIWDNFGTQLDLRTIIQQWKEGDVVRQATDHGYRVLWSPSTAWYLSRPGTFWTTMYAQEPCANVSAERCELLVLGGGGELWGESVDASDLLSTAWPRLAAIGERLWSPRNVTSLLAALPRLQALRCRMNQRGYAAAPVNNPEARAAPRHPNSCYVQ